MKLTTLTDRASDFLDRDPSMVWSSEQVGFSDAARTAARQALYHTRLLDPGHEDVWADFLLGEIRQCLAPVVVPSPDACCSDQNREACVFKGARRPFEELLLRWRRIGRLAGLPEPLWSDGWELSRPEDEVPAVASERLADMDAELVAFLAESQPMSGFLRITYVWIPAALNVLRRYTGLLLGVAATAGAVVVLEAVHSLYLNSLPITIGCVAATGAVPLSLSAFAGWSRSRRDTTPGWDRGGRLHRSIAPHPLPPAPWRPRHPSDGASHEIALGRLVRLALMISSWLVIGLVVVTAAALGFVDDVAVTVYAITVFFFAVSALGSAADFVDLHAQPPFRRSLVIGLGLYLLAIVVLDSPVVGIGLLILWMLALIHWADKVGIPENPAGLRRDPPRGRHGASVHVRPPVRRTVAPGRSRAGGVLAGGFPDR